jgi:peptide/nickel transport system substrate-binding protein
MPYSGAYDSQLVWDAAQRKGKWVMVGRSLKTMVVSIVAVVSMLLCVPIVFNSVSDHRSTSSANDTMLRIGYLRDIDSLNPFVGLNDVSFFFYSLVYDSLTTVGNDLEAVPDLAKECWPVPITDPEMTGMPFGSIWQYNLTTNAFWSDGEPFTADDVVYNIWLSADITHYNSMWAFQPYSYFMNTAWKVDNYTVRVSFWERGTGSPSPASYADQITMTILPKHMLESFPFTYIGMNWNGTFTDAVSPGMPIVGTGPFIATPSLYSDWIAGTNITLLKNPNCHWETDYNKSIKFDKISLRFYDDVTSMQLALATNQIDAAEFPPSGYAAIESAIGAGTLKNVTTFDGPKPTQYFTDVGFCMNNAGPNPSRLDPVIREALHMATNKENIVDTYYLGFADEGSTLIAPVNSYWHYEPNASEIYNYSLTSAAALLEANGYVDVDSDGIRECTIGSPAVQLGYVSEGKKLTYEMLVRHGYPEEKDIAAYLKDQWAQIGVGLIYAIVDEATLSGTVYSYEYDTVLWYWSSDVDPEYILFTQSKRAWNAWSDNKYFNPEFEANYNETVITLDPGTRKTAVDKCQSIFYNDSAYIVLAYLDQTYALRTDTFAGWGNWSAHPGRSLDSFWSGNPILFDLTPLSFNHVPSIVGLSVNPNPVLPSSVATLTVAASDLDAEALNVLIDFGDGSSEVAVGSNATYQEVEFTHTYTAPGIYNVTVCVDDKYPDSSHNVTRFFAYRILVGPPSALVATISPDNVNLTSRDWASLTANLSWLGAPLGVDPSNVSYSWRTSPWGLGSFWFAGSGQMVNFTAGQGYATGSIICNMTYYDLDIGVIANLTINPDTLGSVNVTPPETTMIVGDSGLFTASAVDIYGYPVQGMNFTWTVGGLLPGEYDLTQGSPDSSYALFTGYVSGIAWLNASVTVDNITVNGSSTITIVSSLGDRKVDYEWSGMFAVPFGEWWEKRWEVYSQAHVLSNSYPYIYEYFHSPNGNKYYYTSARLNITGTNMSEVNMTSWPEFLPLLGTERGGNATIDWYMQYLTEEELLRYGSGIVNQNDGLIIGLNGTVVLDEQAAKAVLNMSDSDFDAFSLWWISNGSSVQSAYMDWIVNEAHDRLDITNAYRSYFQVFVFDLDAERIGDSIVLHYDTVTWGMEALMMRWLREAFMPSEWWYEDMNFHASIGPTSSSVLINTAVENAMFADETILLTNGTKGAPCWTWHSMLQDSVPSSFSHPWSEFDAYEPLSYQVHRPGSAYYGTYMSYDYTPGAWDLKSGETLGFTWPSGEQQFKYHISSGVAGNATGEMEVTYSEPMNSDLPGQVQVDESAHTITFVGPIDASSWSENQTAHTFLASEWNRLGILPYGQPLVEFSMVAPLDITPPQPVASANPNPADFASTVELNGSLSTDDVGIVDFNWTFVYDGVGQELHGKVVEFVFVTPGTYNITLNCTDAAGNYNTTSFELVVNPVIPEFGPIVLVTVGMLAVFMVVWRTRRRRID